ncbi:MAG: S-layer homology domain-containing protein [Patescibacteria group bacterium]
MSSFRKFTAALAALAVTMTSVFTFSVAVAATTFTDASKIASWASSAITTLADDGVLSGRPDGSFDPQGQLNRAEMAKIAVKAAGLTEDTTGAPHFNDVKAADWFYAFVETLYNNGVVGGINGGALDANGLATFNPSGTLNRAEGSKILVDAFELETAYAGTPPNFPDVASSAWYYDYVETSYAHGILNGYDNGNFGPSDPITREQVAVIAQNSRLEAADGSKRRTNYTAGAASSVEPTTTPGTTPTSDGTLTVSKSASSPADQTFPGGAAATAVAAYDFTATSDAVVVTNVVVKRTGVGTDSGWTLYLYDGNNRLTSGKTINSTSHEATFTGLNVSVAAGTTKTLTLKADTGSGSGESYFEIEAAAKVTSNAKSVGGSFPIVSNKQKIDSTVTAGTIQIEKTGSITNPKVGEKDVLIGKFKLTTAGEAGYVKQIALLVSGTISSSDVQNAKLYQGSTLLATAAATNSKDLLVFNLATPFFIEKGDSRNFDVKADLSTGRSADSLKVYLDEKTDLVATGGTYGFGMTVKSVSTDTPAGSYDGTSCANSSGDCSYSALQGGDITISSSGPSATQVAVNGKDIPLLNFNITSVSPVTFKKFSIVLTTNDAGNTAGGLLNAGVSNYTDIKIVNKDTGAVLMGPVDATSLTQTAGGSAITSLLDVTGYYVFQDEFTMAAGESLNLAITTDIANNTDTAFTNDTIHASIDINATYPEVKDVNNKSITNTTSLVPSSDIDGKDMTISSPSLTVALASNPAPGASTYVKGAKDVCYAGFSIAAGDASNVKITSFKVDGYIDGTGSAGFTAGSSGASPNTVYVKDDIGALKLMDGTTQVGASKSVQSDGTVTFDNLTYNIAAGETKLLKVCGDISSNAFRNTNTEYLAFSIPATTTYIVAEDKDGNSVDFSGSANTTQSTYVAVSQGGTLTIAVDADTPKEDIIVAGAADVAISKFKISATSEPFIVKKLAINNRQSGVAAGNLGDYDNNVAAIKITYKNSAGTTESKMAYLTNGTADFSGLDIAVPKDGDTTVAVSAALNTITTSGGATAGEFVDLNVALDNFEATAQGSGDTYYSNKLGTASPLLSIGTITYTDATTQAGTATASVVAGASKTLTTADLGISLPVGTLVRCGTAPATAYATGTDILLELTTAYISGATSLVGFVANAGDGTCAAADWISYSLPGTGYLTAAHQMAVYESKPTIALASSSPSGSRTAAASDGIFIFTVSADAAEKIQIRAGLAAGASGYGEEAAAPTALTAGPGSATRVSSTPTPVAGTYAVKILDGAALASGDGFTLSAGSAGLLNGYTSVSGWLYINDANSNDTLNSTQISVCTSTTATVCDNAQALGTSTTAYTESAWVFWNTTVPAATDASDLYFGLKLGAAMTDATDYVAFDDIRFYNEKLVVDFASDGSLSAASGTSYTANGLVAYLKEGGSTVATGYINQTSLSAASVTFIPTTAIEVAKGTSKTFTVETATTTLISDSPGTDDLLTPSITLGSSTDGTVSAGGFWWNETNATVKWLGQVSSTTLNGNTLKY